MLPRIQHPAPNFTVEALMPNKTFQEISLKDYKGKYVVLFYYPLDFTFVCPTEIIAFGDAQPEFAKINTQLIAASCDSTFSHLAWVNTPRNNGGLGHMQIPIIADFDKKVATDYGVLLDDTVPLRALFIISPEGVVRHITVNDLPVGRNVDEILRLVQAFQFVEEHGEVCPANWTPGQKTMKADPLGSKQYFSTVDNTVHVPTPSAASNASTTGSAKSVAKAPAVAAPVAVIPEEDKMQVSNEVPVAAVAKKRTLDSMNSIVEVTSDEQFASVIASNNVTIVDFWAPWCHNCKKIMPTVQDMANEFPSTSFYKVNAEELTSVAETYKVDMLPTVLFFRKGELIGNVKGSIAANIEAKIRNAIDGTA